MNLEHLPKRCYATNEDGQLIMILRGVMGYNLLIQENPMDRQDIFADPKITNQKYADNTNISMGISQEEVDVMIGGSMFGWDTPLVLGYKSV